MKKPAITLVLTLLSGVNLAQAEELPACQLMDEQQVMITAMDDVGTLKTQLSGEAGLLPNASFSLLLSDGREIYLGEGGKFTEEPGADCDDHLREATMPIINSLKGDGVFFDNQEIVDMRSFDKLLNNCPVTDMTPPDYLQTTFEKAKEASSWQSEFLQCEPVYMMMEMGIDFSKTDIDTFNRLLKNNAPLVAVPYSVYGWEIKALDLETGRAIDLFTSGC